MKRYQTTRPRPLLPKTNKKSKQPEWPEGRQEKKIRSGPNCTSCTESGLARGVCCISITPSKLPCLSARDREEELLTSGQGHDGKQSCMGFEWRGERENPRGCGHESCMCEMPSRDSPNDSRARDVFALVIGKAWSLGGFFGSNVRTDHRSADVRRAATSPPPTGLCASGRPGDTGLAGTASRWPAHSYITWMFAHTIK